jgi:hypothetical protein
MCFVLMFVLWFFILHNLFDSIIIYLCVIIFCILFYTFYLLYVWIEYEVMIVYPLHAIFIALG